MQGLKVRSVQLAIGAAAVALFGLGALSRTATAFNPQPDPPAFGMIGIAQGQTARLNIVEVSPGPCRASEVSPGPCRVQLTFLDADGNTVVTSRGVPVTKTVTLTPGRAESIDLNANELLTDGARVEVRGFVKITGRLVQPGPCRLTIEIFDNLTGRTEAFYSARMRGAQWGE